MTTADTALLFVAAVSLVAVLRADAQQPPPSVSDTADRPGFADSPVLLRRGHIQVESGFMWEREGHGAGRTKTLTLPQVELHAGITERLEVSVAWDGLVSSAVMQAPANLDRRSSGWADVRLGAKFGLVTRASVNCAVIGYVDLPAGSDSVSSGYGDPLTRFAWGISASDHIGLWGTADLGATRDADGRVRAKPAASASVGTTVLAGLSGFIGIVAESPPFGSTPDVWSVEAGLTLPLGVHNQVDVWTGRRVAGGPDDWFVGAGFVRRLR